MKPMVSLAALVAMIAAAGSLRAEEVIAPINTRFAAVGDEVPDFQKHVSPLMGKLGCNGRACHGSFQGQGGFRLSLFGYDFKMDHEQLTKGDEPRVDLEFPEDSLALLKPTLEMPHRGGKRMAKDGWEYHVFLKWMQSGAKVADEPLILERLEVTPAEIQFGGKDETATLKAIAVWADGTREDVTTLCRFQTNDEQVASISNDGLVTSAEPGDTHVVVYYDKAVVPIPVLRPVSDKFGPKYPESPAPTKVDQLVLEKLGKLGIVQSETCTDAEFLRRASLDITGTLPTAGEVEQFLADSTLDKRAQKIDELLERPGYTAWWTTLLCDFTGNNVNALNNVHPVRAAPSQEWYDWIAKRVAENTPYDQLAAGIILAKSRNDGESFEEFCQSMSALYADDPETRFADRDDMPYYWARRTFRTPDDRAIGFAYAFMGLRIQCAQCHKHPFDQWSQDDFKQFTGFFRGVNFGVNPESRKEYNAMLEEFKLGEKKGNDLRKALPGLLKEGKIVPFQEVYVARARAEGQRKGKEDARSRSTAAAATAKVLGGEKVDLTQVEDPRQPLMDWLRAKDNPYFARAFVNRVWANYFGIGIVDPPDDLSLANPPSNRALLDYLSEGFIASGFDMKWLHREIANSRTYQLSWQPNETNRADEKNFSRALPRRMPAEAAYDALQLATASDEKAADLQRNLEGRGIAMAGYAVRANSPYALTVFGKSIRESNCDCDRSMEPNLLQTVYLRNDQDVLSMIDRRDGWLNEIAAAAGMRLDGRPSERPKPNEKGQKRQRNDDDAADAIQRLEAQLRKAKKADDEKRSEQLEQKLAQLRKNRSRDRDKPEAAKSEPVKLAAFDTDHAIRQAYLRTVSRYPTDEELALARMFVADSEDTINGVRGVLWALLNTKEFIVNH